MTPEQGFTALTGFELIGISKKPWYRRVLSGFLVMLGRMVIS